MKFGVVSLGCSKNTVDSEVMMSLLTKANFELTNDQQQAEIIIVNTCGFIESAKEESINTILEMAQKKQDAKCKTLVVTGCLTQRYKEQLQKELPEVDIMLGVNEYNLLAPMLIKLHNPTEQTQKQTSACQTRVLSTPSHYAYLKIAEGCDNRCSYCAIPGIRGGFRSREIDDILNEANQLVQSGVKELIVIAQDTTRYGLDIYKKTMLSELLKKLCKTNIQWVRVLYAYPDEIDDELIETMAKEEKIVKYIDIPVQHGDDAVLKAMNRRGSAKHIEAIAQRFKKANNDFVLRTSFIVGFPGETQENFENLKEFVKQIKFARAGVFEYSPEEDTPAYDFKNQISQEIKQKRFDELMVVQQQISKEFNLSRVGKTYSCMVENFNEQTQSFKARSFAEAPEIDGLIFFESQHEHKPGEFVNVKILKALEYDLIGELV